jgi:hypothetical protein
MRTGSGARLVTEPCSRVKRPRNVHGKRHGPAEHLRLLKTGSERLAFVNSQTFGANDAEREEKTASYVTQLSKLGIAACGVAEARIPENGHRTVTGGWHLIWSGLPATQKKERGVAMLLEPRWARCLIDWSAISERILVVRVRISEGINASIVVAYSPTDLAARADKDAFYLQLHSTIGALPARDMLILLGDFNGQVGTDPAPYGGVMGQWGLDTKTTDNGERLLHLAAACNLRLANTFFKHSKLRTATHAMKVKKQGKEETCFRVIDYIAVSKRLMSSVTDCRVFRSFVASNGLDHSLLVLTLRLRLSTAKQRPVGGQKLQFYNCSKLQNSAAARQCFQLDLSNRFSCLVGAPLDTSQEEWRRLQAAAQQAAHVAGLDLPQRQRPRDFALSAKTMQKIERKHAAHAAVLSNPCAASKAMFRAANNAAKAAVRRDQERYYKQQAEYAEAALRGGNLGVFHKHVQRIFGEQQGSKSAAPMSVLGGPDGKQVLQSREEVVKRFAEHFADVLNCPTTLDPQMQQTIEDLVQQVEQGRGAMKQPDSAAELPTLKEVIEAVQACRNGASPGVDGIGAPMLKLSGTMVEWLHRVIVAVWQSGCAPVEWKRALLVALYKGKGERKLTDNYRGISLLSIPGKVYVLILLSRISSHVDAQLLDSQSAFRKGRGLTDALFTIRQVISRCVEFNEPLFMAFVDLRKAYDSVPRESLWQILRVYGVHAKLVELLEDLHKGTQAAVRMGGSMSEWFDVRGGVRQGCVISPLLFNIYMDFVVKQALAQMPEGCGVELAYHADGKLQRKKWGRGESLEVLSVLLYADDMVLMSNDRGELATMLQVMDRVSAGMGLRINASKTEIMAIKLKPKKGSVEVEQEAEEVVIGEGVVKEVSQFKYLGSVLVADGKLDVELNIRKGRAYGRFSQFEKLWGSKHLSVSTKVKCYRAYVLPILLFGSETWALTQEQSLMLERVHTSCLRSILGVKLSDRHSNAHVRSVCGIASLAAIITTNRLRWLGHVGRMEPGRLPHVALFSSLYGMPTRKRRGAPPLRWEKCVLNDLGVVGVPEEDWEAKCQLKCVWRKMLWEFSHPGQESRPLRASGRRGQQTAVQYAERYSVPFPEPAADAAAEGVNLNWWEPTAAPTRVLLNPEGSPLLMFPSV